MTQPFLPGKVLAEGTSQRVKCLQAFKFWEYNYLPGLTINQYSLDID